MDRYVDQFRQFRDDGARSAPEWVNDVRRKSIDRFKDLGFPTTRDEDWHFTSVGPIAEHDFTFVASPTGCRG